ncbi:hypothetical protein MKX01_029150, partial [Papaver californicum]
MPEKQGWSSPIFCYLIGRKINVEPEKIQQGEVWFNVKGRDLCFFKKDFSVITGLSLICHSSRGAETHKQAFSQIAENHSSGFVRLFFIQNETFSIHGASIRRSLKITDVGPVPCSAEDRVKVALLLIVHMFLLGNQNIHFIDEDLWRLVDNLSYFNKVSWGERLYLGTFDKTQKAYEFPSEKEAPPEQPSIKPQGIPQVLV